MIFIDGSNLYHQLKNAFGSASIDFAKFASLIAGEDRELVRVYYYNSSVIQNDDPDRYQRQQNFFEKLYRIPKFEVRLGRLERRENGAIIEKGVDIKLAADMLTKAFKNHYDVAVLVSGDGDFAYVVEEVKDNAKHVEVVTFPNQPCYHLQKTCDEIINFTKDSFNQCSLEN